MGAESEEKHPRQESRISEGDRGGLCLRTAAGEESARLEEASTESRSGKEWRPDFDPFSCEEISEVEKNSSRLTGSAAGVAHGQEITKREERESQDPRFRGKPAACISRAGRG